MVVTVKILYGSNYITCNRMGDSGLTEMYYNGNSCLPNENKQKTIITCNKVQTYVKRPIFVLPNYFLQDIFTSED